MTDKFTNDEYNMNSSENTSSSSDTGNTEDVVSSINSESNTDVQAENSYEWNSDSTQSQSSEYHYSYINGNNQTASHNPNNYDNAYSTTSYSDNATQGYNSTSSYSDNNVYSNSNTTQGTYSGSTYNSYSNSPYGQQSSNQYGSYNSSNAYNQPNPSYYGYNTSNSNHGRVKKAKVKKPKKSASRGFVVGALIVAVVATSAFGFCGGVLYSNLSKSSGSLKVNKIEASATDESSNRIEGTATSVVQKSANSVVEITTESVVLGSFNRQYVSSGAGSGVIISEDGYIVTNNHVISGANSIKVTLRDGQTTYDAELIGTDAANDIALIKVDATGLSAATFGDSSTLAVGDYVVAIGNPLGQLGGTVTDGIISALAREVTIDEQNMTLLQTNAEINPGNSGGGLFDSNGNLIGIVNAKSSATEVEGIGFAIPINNVFDIIDDLKNYGYVTGEVDLGMEFVDINSTETAFYYGVNKTGCYVLSVTSDSNADKAGFRAGDLIKKVGNTEVTTTADIKSAISDNEVGDKVNFTIIRNNKTIEIVLTLAEYVPTSDSSNKFNQSNNQSDNSDNSFWNDMFGWY
ncbi:MAG: trypsin-like peptidase domain-containing protein [Ruminococcus sp.]|nr:trypsin-like peptidase domain-containing protein [Ruminococcus sp.]